MKTLLKLIFALAIAAAGALTVLFEYFPESAVTAKLAPYCEGPYLIAKAQTVSLYELVKTKLSKSAEEPEPEAEAESDAIGKTVATMNRSEERDVTAAEEPKAKAEVRDEDGAKAADKTPPTLAKARWYTGSRVSESSCRGKVVVVCVWNAEVPESLELLAQTQRIADGFGRKKDLVVFASHRGGSETAAKKELTRARVTIPVCEGAGLPCAMRIAGTPPYFYLVDKKGTLKYVGRSDKAVLTKMSELF